MNSNSLTIANPPQAASPAPATAAAASGEAGDGDLDFSGLLGAGIERTTEPAQAREPAQAEKTEKDAGGDTPELDPAALLDAIAAGKAGLDPQQPAAAQVAVQPMPAAPAPADPITPAIDRGGMLAAGGRAEGGRSVPQADAQRTAVSPCATDSRHEAQAASAVTVAGGREPAAVPVPRAELAERRQEPASQPPTIGSAPGFTAAQSQSVNPARAVVHMEHLALPFRSPGWDDGFSSCVLWMARNEAQSAEIRLNPPDLGPIEVKLVLTGDQGAQASASMQFSAAHAATREAIESALPRLREMLLENGIALGNATVDAGTAGNADGSGDSGRQAGGSARSDEHAGRTPDSAMQPLPGSPLRRGSGLVDTFA